MVDRVEISIIEEEQPRWLAFLNGELDAAGYTGAAASSSTQAMPNGKLAPNLAKQRHPRLPHARSPTARSRYFNMEDPVVGGYAPEKVALRRAISLAYDIDEEIRLIRQRPGDRRRSRRCCRTPPATTRTSRAR